MSVKYKADEICHEQATCTIVVEECAHRSHSVGWMYLFSSSVESRNLPQVYKPLLTSGVVVVVVVIAGVAVSSVAGGELVSSTRDRARNSARSTMFCSVRLTSALSCSKAAAPNSWMSCFLNTEYLARETSWVFSSNPLNVSSTWESDGIPAMRALISSDADIVADCVASRTPAEGRLQCGW